MVKLTKRLLVADAYTYGRLKLTVPKLTNSAEDQHHRFNGENWKRKNKRYLQK